MGAIQSDDGQAPSINHPVYSKPAKGTINTPVLWGMSWLHILMLVIITIVAFVAYGDDHMHWRSFVSGILGAMVGSLLVAPIFIEEGVDPNP